MPVPIGENMDEITKLKAEIFDLQVEMGRVQKEIKDKLNALNTFINAKEKNETS